MGDAEGQLGEGNADGAVDSQGRALERAIVTAERPRRVAERRKSSMLF
jgi:hypothetical protein